MKLLISLIAGILFGLGLTISGMINPQKILNFLDFAAISSGGWDPTLAFVFAGALGVKFVAVRVMKQREVPLLGQKYHVPVDHNVDAELLLGSALFGLGWGLAGFCPGPAFSALAVATTHLADVAIFVGFMFTGILLAIFYKSSRSHGPGAAV